MKNKTFKIRAAIVIFEIGIILFLLIVWMSSKSIRESKSLWILFLYNFPSQFLIAIVPHEPVFLFYSKFYAPLTVTVVATIGTVITEYLNYSIFGFFAEFRPVQKFKNGRVVQKILLLFKKAPFSALWIAGISPIPFYPFRFMVVLSDYPLWKYLLAVLTSRFPRFYLFALAGRAIQLPNYILITFFGAITVVLYVPLIRKLRKKKQLQQTSLQKQEKILDVVESEQS
ncbi:MAG: VTT domain-containing protein [Calditrichaeota bacterium]|nr:VTT domain-containing protein [Calditrichota bacterium]